MSETPPLDLPQPKFGDLTIDDHEPCLDPPPTTLELGGLDRTDSMEHLGPTLPFELDLDPRPQPLDLEKLFQDPMILESCLLGPATHTLEPPLGPATHEMTKIELNNALLYPPEIENIDFIGICLSPTHTTLHENGFIIFNPLHIKSKKSINLYLLPLTCEAYSSGLTFAYHIFKSYITSTHEKTTTFMEGQLLIFRKGGLPPEMLKIFKSNSPEENFLPPGKSDAGAWSPIKLPVKHGPPNPW
ncbi:hypothetical protein GFJ39_13925, partial [Gluconobacter sp. AC10]|nr:hypothetical protein [Gluconobacter aidae]